MVAQVSPEPETKERILRTAFQLFHEQGFHATGVATIVREAGINPGSLYHFFESKDQLLLNVLEFAIGYLGPAVMDPVESHTPDPIARIFALLGQYRDGMVRHGCRMGCPIGNLALEVSDGNLDARRLIHRNFENWASRVEGWLVEAGDRLPPEVNRGQLARFVLTVMEGGLMQARAANDLRPFDDSVAVLRDHLNLLLRAPAERPRTGKQRRNKTRTRR
ncbi:MAG TPA: TetR/AcrR family transcriptional regulator [Bryobacteraceae bacterium]|nr:TetR/AcrR family transcriptional regulator [Bryobacteraceae bacterium]